MPRADIYLFGQEVNPETWAVSKSDIFMKDPTGRDAESIAFGSTLSNDRHAGQTFDYLIANPPYGKDWKRDQETVEAEHQRGALWGASDRAFRASATGRPCSCSTCSPTRGHSPRAARASPSS